MKYKGIIQSRDKREFAVSEENKVSQYHNEFERWESLKDLKLHGFIDLFGSCKQLSFTELRVQNTTMDFGVGFFITVTKKE